MKNLTKLIRDEKKMFKNYGLKIIPNKTDSADRWSIDAWVSRERKKHRGIYRLESKLKTQQFI